MPAANVGENEVAYNQRLENERPDWVCLDRELIYPTGATSTIEACDFFVPPGHFVHIKDQSASYKLSHLFNQGVVSAEVFKTDDEFRSKLSEIVLKKSDGALGSGLPTKSDIVNAANFTVVFVVLREQTGASPPPVLPFFSLVTFRQAAKRLQALGYKYAFAWVFKETPPKEVSPKKQKGKLASTEVSAPIVTEIFAAP